MAARLKGHHPPPAPAANAEQRMAFKAELPGPVAGAPLLQLSLEFAEKAEADGARLRVRAHLRSSLSNSQATGPSGGPALSADRPSATQALARGIGRTIADVLRQPRIKALAAPFLEHEINSWFELQVSTEPLDGGAAALLPAPERLARLGVVPRSGPNAPMVESWIGDVGGGRPGFAQLSLVRIARDQLPPRVAALLGSRPLQLAAALVNTVERESTK